MNLRKKFLSVAIAVMSLCVISGTMTMVTPTANQMVYAMTEEGAYTAESYKDISELWTYVGSGYDAEYLAGKQIPNEGTVASAMWISNLLTSNHGVEFKMSMAESDWEAMPGVDSTWYGGSWSAPARGQSAIQITVDSGHEIIIYKNAAGNLAVNSKSCVDNSTQTIELEGLSFAGEHTYKYVNVAGTESGSQVRLYIDDVLVFTHSVAGASKGNHIFLYNFTGYDVTVRTLYKAYTQEVYDDVYDITEDEEFYSGKTASYGEFPIQINHIDFNNNNGIAFKTTISKEDWNSVECFDASDWDGGQPFKKGALFIETKGFNNILVYKTQNGLGISSKMLVGDEKTSSVVLRDFTLANKHNWRIVNINGEYEGAKTCLYLDNELVYTIETDERLSGTEFNIGNFMDIDVVFRSKIVRSQYEPNDYAYSMMIVPDTQNVNYFHSEYFSDIYDYIVENVEAKNVQHVFGLGDITQIDTTDEWVRAKEQITRMDGLVSYSLVRGNHDLNNINTGWEYTFGANSSYANQYIAKYRNSTKNTIHAFSVGQLDYMVVALDYGASDEVLEWAGNIISANPHHNVIITTHAYLDNDGGILDDNGSHPPTLDGGVNNADDYWDKLVGQYENIVMIISGHMTGCLINERQGVHGNTVKQLLLDFQNYEREGMDPLGIINTMYFSEDGKTVTLDTYSTIQEYYYQENNQFTFTLDTVARDENNVGFVDVIPDSDIYELMGDIELIDGKTVEQGGGIYKHWIESALKVSNGFTFKATIPQEAWDSAPTISNIAQWGTPSADTVGMLYLETNGFHEMYIYKTEKGIGVSSKFWKGNAESGTVEIEGLSLAGEHTYRYVNMATKTGAQGRLYIDGKLVYTLDTTGTLQGYHQRIWNFMGSDIVLKTTLDMSKNNEVSTDIYDYSGDAELLWPEGKTLNTQQSIGKMWMSGQLLGANGFELNAIVSNWQDWTEGDYTVGLIFRIDSYHDLYLYRTANGVGIYSKFWVGAGESKTVELVGYSLAGEHNYKFTNSNNYGVGSTSKLYLDGELVFTATTTGDLRGYHSLFVNNTGADITVYTSQYDRSQVMVGEPGNTDIFEYTIESFTAGVSEVGAHSVYWNSMACAQAVDIMFRLDTTDQRWDDNGADGYIYYSFGTGAGSIGVSLYKNHGDSDKSYVWIYDWSGKVAGYGEYLENNFSGEISVHISLTDVRYKGVLLGIKCQVQINDEIVTYILARDYPTTEAQFYIDNNTSVALKHSSDLEGFRKIYAGKLAGFKQDDYSASNWNALNAIIEKAMFDMANVFTVAEICSIGDKACEEASVIWTIAQEKALQDFKATAKIEASEYLVLDNYYEEQQARITTILENFNVAVDNAEAIEEIVIRLNDVKTLLDSVATRTEIDEVVLYRAIVKVDLEVLVAQYKQSDYSTENWKQVLDIKETYLVLVEQTESMEELESIITLAQADLDAVKTLEDEPNNPNSGNSGDNTDDSSNNTSDTSTDEEGGCSSSISLGIVAVMMSLGMATMAMKKRKDE